MELNSGEFGMTDDSPSGEFRPGDRLRVIPGAVFTVGRGSCKLVLADASDIEIDLELSRRDTLVGWLKFRLNREDEMNPAIDNTLEFLMGGENQNQRIGVHLRLSFHLVGILLNQMQRDSVQGIHRPVTGETVREGVLFRGLEFFCMIRAGRRSDRMQNVRSQQTSRFERDRRSETPGSSTSARATG